MARPDSKGKWSETASTKVLEKAFPKTFAKGNELGTSYLQLDRLKSRKHSFSRDEQNIPSGNVLEDAEDKQPVDREVGDEIVELEGGIEIRSKEELLRYKSSSDLCQIFTISQRHTHTRLNISSDLFGQLVETYDIFSRIEDFVPKFSFKTTESNIGHASFRYQHNRSEQDKTQTAFECAYGLQYVVLNNRVVIGQPDHDPWSIRQTAIYQQYDSVSACSMFILISPAPEVRQALQKALLRARDLKSNVKPFELHFIIVSTLQDNWRLYIESLEELMEEKSQPVMLAEITGNDPDVPPQVNFTIKFDDRQKIKLLEDKVLDLLVIFEALYNTLFLLRRRCERNCLGKYCNDCSCNTIAEDLEEQMLETQMNLKKAKVLHKRAQATAQLLSDLLDYENALIAQSNERALTELARETKDENSKMRILSERSTRDATTVKILTVITLIYLPMTVVANLFSSQLVQVNDEGAVSVIKGAWWFVVIAVPLTALTISVWLVWLRQATKQDERKHARIVENERLQRVGRPTTGQSHGISLLGPSLATEGNEHNRRGVGRGWAGPQRLFSSLRDPRMHESEFP